MKSTVTSGALFEWARGRARTAEAAGRGTRYPTLREACEHFGISQDRAEELLDEGTDLGYLGLAVGVRTMSGTGSFRTRGECLVEAY